MTEQTPNSRDTNTNPTSEQVHHSGVHGNELPAHDFDMALPDALEAGAVHHVELDEAGNPVFNLPDTLADFSEPGKSPKTEAYEPLLAPVKEKNGKRGLAAAVAGVVGAALLGGGYVAYRSASQVDVLDRAPTSASPSRLEADTPQTSSPEGTIGVAGTNLDTLNTPPTPELLRDGLQPVTVAEYPTPEASIERFEDLINLRDLSGSIDEAGGLHESAESVAQRNGIDAIIFEGGTPHFDDNESTDTLREALAVSYWYINKTDAGPSNIEATYRKDWVIDGLEQTGADEYSASLSITRSTNLPEFDSLITENINDITNTDLTGEIVIVQQGDAWFVRSLEMHNV